MSLLVKRKTHCFGGGGDPPNCAEPERKMYCDWVKVVLTIMCTTSNARVTNIRVGVEVKPNTDCSKKLFFS